MGRAHEKSSQSMLLFLMQKNQITCIKNEVMVILLIEKVIDNKMFPKSTAGLYISDSYQRNFISHRHRIFYGLPLFVHSKKFYVTEACISCQKCVGFCPMKNIGFTGGKPVWGHNCTHCMACICRCPAEAIEYGKHSKGLPRYVFPHDDFM